jgi:ribosome biogenesis GTPase
LKKGRVIKNTGSWYTVKTDESEILNCKIKGKFRLKGIKTTNPVAVGDWVEFDDSDETPVISKILDRNNYIIRKSSNLSKQAQIIAANIDQTLLVVTINYPMTTTTFIDRYLAAAKAYSIDVKIIFNKTDRYQEEELDKLDELIDLYSSIGYECCAISAKNNDGIDKVKELMKDKTSLFSGHSGVGKSTLINIIQPGLDLRTKEISDSHKQGKHTTTFAEMFELDFGGYIIDTPGIRGFGTFDMDKSEISHYFVEFFELADKCKFNNCMHINEPQCAVKEALENGEIHFSRYESYLSMIDEGDMGKYRL